MQILLISPKIFICGRGNHLNLHFVLISAVCSCGYDNVNANRVWRLFDARCGSVVSLWQAQDGYTQDDKKDHLLVFSSLDKTVRVWDLRNSSWSGPSQSYVFRCHSDGVAGLAVWDFNFQE
ncbi:hypothetical protein AQUCO_02400063v1 [Aquilegia coerulea]|uniref:Uncharacterized protein n=1 Tax=Aquilegia coerulea TaxID=218851 RepID=A0A2G5DB22_AQUCA|nr:hypothetical protein AQUCO_02400063v1 [Aquilegia coerulea]